MPVWLEVIFGGVPGTLGLVMAAIHLGALRRDVHDLLTRAAGWDQMKTDLAYLRGRFDGTLDNVVQLQDQINPPVALSRSRQRQRAQHLND